ncbi:hypothetical protein KAFR_0A00480 [Kazachstania africana CBS 2517]|uniref:RING-type domain-containing protein n=1 Tax=Kazachstania africana (strain ATCC 22294 / BCRC 22015 / CBS 2517 / CECT 1963 / NBRC 1671 / NRRL Y-8276) TaxID=1071382 RepID=H2AM86_KAZAF|nr:hypothetical protein KAFR_0A00480 [Kazachstania africana CBS 2517]CCF55486.1 hypothetical protein KAFR_0A00480 [Kazachstania africana CBS 2517]
MNSTIIEKLPYLNQTSHYILGGRSVVAKLINTPYRLLLALFDAVKLQFWEQSNTDEFFIGQRWILNTIGFFFSSYGVICFITSILLNRFVLLSSIRSRRSNTNNTTILPSRLRFVLHFSVTLLLSIILFQPLLNSNLLSYPHRLFIVFTLSYIVETVVAISSNQIPLEGSDYSIFELSLQFYILKTMKVNITNSPELLADCMVAIASRIIIHFVEMFNTRKSRLLMSTCLNMTYLGFLMYRMSKNGFFSIPISIIFRHFPKLFSLFIVIASFTCYLLACAVRFNPTAFKLQNLQDLKFYSFMNNWSKHLNFNGDEDFSTIINKLAILLYLGTDNKDKNLNNEFPYVNVPLEINKLFTISSYLNFNIEGDEEIMDEETIIAEWGNGVHNNTSLLTKFIKFLKKCIANPNQLGNEATFSDDTQVDIDEKAYMTEINDTILSNDDDDDNDFNYLPDFNEEENIDDDDYDSDLDDISQDDSLYIMNALDLISPNTTILHSKKNLDWYLSTREIFSKHLQSQSRLTRSKYSTIKLNNSSESTFEENADDLSCAVCKANQRNIIFWPCKCFAVCEDCRISLSLRNYNSCICCRRPVNGYTKLQTK